jgi:acyl carrier protein
MDVAGDVKAVIAKELKVPVEQLTDDTQLADLGVESLDVIEIVFALEEKFDIDISLKMSAQPAGVAPAAPAPAGAGGAPPPTDLSGFTSVGDICRAVQALVDAKASK